MKGSEKVFLKGLINAGARDPGLNLGYGEEGLLKIVLSFRTILVLIIIFFSCENSSINFKS